VEVWGENEGQPSAKMRESRVRKLGGCEGENEREEACESAGKLRENEGYARAKTMGSRERK
jgi:hypothetical protein